VSQILDALRRKKALSRMPPSAERRAAHADAVLATLGYGRAGGPGRVLGRLGTYVLVLVVLVASGWLLVDWVRTPAPVAPSGTAAAVPLQPPGLTVPSSPLAGAPARAPVSPPQTVASPRSGSVPSRTASTGVTRVEPAPSRPVHQPAPPGPRIEAAATSAAKSPGPSASLRETTPAATRPLSEADHFRLALYYHRAGDFENALVHYRAVLQRTELNAEVHNNLGLLYEQKGLFSEAEQEFQRALFIDPGYAKAYNNLGVALLRQGRLDQAAGQFRSALKVDPRNVDAMVNLALVFKASGRADEARAELLRALGVDSHDAPSHYNLALLYEEAGETSTAVQHYRLFLLYGGAEHARLVPDVRARLDALTARLR
jgi:Tfp pilus assembly protein PilF